MNVVVDASVAIKWFIAEDNTAFAELLLEPVFDLHAPELASSEFGNILWKKIRGGDLRMEEAAAVIDAFYRVGIDFHSNGLLVSAALELAVEAGQTVYDCTYLALAIALDCPFVTADRRLFIGIRRTRFREYAVWVENIGSLRQMS